MNTMKPALNTFGCISLVLALLLPTGWGRALDRINAPELRNTYICRWIDGSAPIDVGHWAGRLSRARGTGDGPRPDSRFLPYGTSASQLVNDSTAVRDYTGGTDDTQTRATTLLSGYSADGWYVYIESKEPLVGEIAEAVAAGDAVRAEGKEIFFSTRPDGTSYHMLMTDQPQGRLTVYPIRPRDHGHWTLDGFIRSDLGVLPCGTGWGTVFFIPWESLHDPLPFHTPGATWEFTVIRWMGYSRSGGVSWGGKVHEPGAWGRMEWDPPTPDQLSEIQRTVIQRAWDRYRAVSQSPARTRRFSHPGFFDEMVAPLLEHEMPYVEIIQSLDTLGAADVAALYGRVEDWMTFDRTLDARLADYLLGRLHLH